MKFLQIKITNSENTDPKVLEIPEVTIALSLRCSGLEEHAEEAKMPPLWWPGQSSNTWSQIRNISVVLTLVGACFAASERSIYSDSVEISSALLSFALLSSTLLSSALLSSALLSSVSEVE